MADKHWMDDMLINKYRFWMQNVLLNNENNDNKY